MYLSQSYPKIETVWDRDPATQHRTLIENSWSLPEFSYLRFNVWIFTEKIDGTNIRVEYRPLTPLFPKDQEYGEIVLGGRTNAAIIPPHLLARLHEMFTFRIEEFERVFAGNTNLITLYGEGFGNRIQKEGHKYIPDGVGFRLFDVKIGDRWLDWWNVLGIARTLGIQNVPEVGRGTLEEAIVQARIPQPSRIGIGMREGLVMRPPITLLDGLGRRIITKVKMRDFEV